MPSSRPNAIPTVVHLIRQLQPRSILDVGVGFGKWGHLFREYTDINESERDSRRYQRENWQIRIDGIEGNAAYLTAMHRFLYNELHVGDACVLIDRLDAYDLVFMGDVIEHLERRRGLQLLRRALGKARKAVIVITPKYDTGQLDRCDNELERHRSLWTAEDFCRFKGSIVKTIDHSTLLAVLLKPGVASPVCEPPKPVKPADARRLERCKAELVERIPEAENFILVDEEQIRCELPHRRMVPFLERDGSYWGPPANDKTAIRELERLRKRGANLIAFAWPSFWWLKHYRGFAGYLEKHYTRVLKSNRLWVYDLRR